MHALHNIHATLAPGAILVDTQPVSAHPQVASDGVSLGSLDMRAWLDTIQAVDALVAETIRIGLYELQHESRFAVTDTFDDGNSRRLARHAHPGQRFHPTRSYNVAGDSAAGDSPASIPKRAPVLTW